MATNKTYEVSGETTEWEDILIKKGITTKEDVLLGKGLDPRDFVESRPETLPSEEELRERAIADATLEELDELEDEFSDSRALDDYRQARILELQNEIARSRYGDVVEISKDEWVSQVTDASKTGVCVCVHLYNDSLVECQLMDECLLNLAPRFPYVKFLKIRATSAVENWPEKNLPTLFVYKAGELKEQLITLRSVGGKSMKPEDLEWWLVQRGVITTSELEENPRDGEDASVRKTVFTLSSRAAAGGKGRRGGGDGDDDSGDDSS